MGPRIEGEVADGWEPVADAFADAFATHGDVGASMCVFHRGEPVVDLWAGLADRDTGAVWQRETLSVGFSLTKGLAAIAFLILEDRGELDLDLPVAHYWPDFARDPVKAGITVRTLLNHRSGLCAVDEPLAIEDVPDVARVEGALIRQAPLWTPGTKQGYGATAWGLYAQCLFRHVTGEEIGQWLRREVFEPLEAEVWIGLPDAEQERVATLYPNHPVDLLKAVPRAVNAPYEGPLLRNLLRSGNATARAFTNPKLGKGGLERMNEPAIRAMELPWMNGIGTSRGVAKVYAALVSGLRIGRRTLVRKAAIERVAPRQSWSYADQVMRKPLGFSQGFVKDEPHLYSPHEASFGHPGLGGAFAFGDPVDELAIAYLPNRMSLYVRPPKAIALCHAAYRVVRGWT